MSNQYDNYPNDNNMSTLTMLFWGFVAPLAGLLVFGAVFGEMFGR